jgi:hypothetical protein
VKFWLVLAFPEKEGAGYTRDGLGWRVRLGAVGLLEEIRTREIK